MEENDDGYKERDAREDRGPQSEASVAEAQQSIDFPIAQLAVAPGGRELAEVRILGSDDVALTYGSGWGSMVLVQKPEREPEGADDSREESSGREAEDRSGRDERSQVPTVDLGDAEAKEISTPIGTGLSWSASGVSYSLVGSVPAAELEEAARGLISGS